MSKIIKQLYGKLTKCINKKTNWTYDDWRLEFIDKPAMLIVMESEHEHPGKNFIYIFPYTAEYSQPYMHTSCGKLEYSGDGCILQTKNSYYEFMFGDYGLSAAKKAELKLNAKEYFDEL